MKDLRTALRKEIPQGLLSSIPRSFDIIGSKSKAVAILEVPEPLHGYEKVIAEALMEVHRNVRSVLAKASERHDTYRTRDLKLIAGWADTEVLHKEAGCLYRLDPKRVYFSPRESAERMRIAEMVKAGESVLVMFSGICPYSIAIARKQLNVKVISVEVNPEAHNYCVQNIFLNKVHDRVTAILGDVKDVCPAYKEKFDRVLMPLPKGAMDYLDTAVPCLKGKGILHFYHWADERDLFSEAERLVKAAAERANREAEILNRVRVLPYGPRTWKVRVDVRTDTRL